MERYRKLKVIGKGSFGYAVLVQSVADRHSYVMKVSLSFWVATDVHQNLLFQIIDVSKMDRKQREDAINEVSSNSKSKQWTSNNLMFLFDRCTCWKQCATRTSSPTKSHSWTRSASASWWTLLTEETSTPKLQTKRRLARVSRMSAVSSLVNVCVCPCNSVLLWRSDSWLVRTDGPGYQAHPRSQNLASWPQNTKHIYDSEWAD